MAQAKQAQAKQAQAKQAQAKLAQAKQAQAKQDQAKQAQTKQAQAKQAQVKQDQAKQDQAKQAQATQVAAKKAQAAKKAAALRARLAAAKASKKRKASASLEDPSVGESDAKDVAAEDDDDSSKAVNSSDMSASSSSTGSSGELKKRRKISNAEKKKALQEKMKALAAQHKAKKAAAAKKAADAKAVAAKTNALGSKSEKAQEGSLKSSKRPRDEDPQGTDQSSEPAKRAAKDTASNNSNPTFLTSLKPAGSGEANGLEFGNSGPLPIPVDSSSASSTPSFTLDGASSFVASNQSTGSNNVRVPIFGSSSLSDNDFGVAPVPVFGDFGNAANADSTSLEFGQGNSSLNANATPFQPPAAFEAPSSLSGELSTGDAPSSSSLPGMNTTNDKSFAGEGFIPEAPAGEDNPFLQNMQGSSSILSGASFTFSGGPNSIDSFGSSSQPNISFGNGMQSSPLAFGVGSSSGMAFGSSTDGTFAGFGALDDQSNDKDSSVSEDSNENASS